MKKVLFVRIEKLIEFSEKISLVSSCGIYELKFQFAHYYQGRRGAVEIKKTDSRGVDIKVSLVPGESTHDFNGYISYKELEELELDGEYLDVAW